ncbi:MAG TPA: hypothetical protein VIL71_22265 [Spirillospora sp.]
MNGRTEFHIGSHVELLRDLSVGNVGTGSIDAIVVPTINPERVEDALELAERLGCVIVLLCSTAPQVEKIRATHRVPAGALLIAVPPEYDHRLLDFEQRKFAKHTDIATKRNIGLLLARLCGWRSIFFLDEDIRGMTPSMISKAAAALTEYSVAGFRVLDFPDNSVVCHAHRASGGQQSTFVGGNCIVVDTHPVETYFPDIYNEDWVFIYDEVAKGSVAVVGELRQLQYDPFSRDAASEEFGDLIAEALVWALHDGLNVSSLFFWEDAIDKRSRFIDEVDARVRRRAEEGRLPGSDRILARLAEARARLQEIKPADCLSFYVTWRENVDIWRQRLRSLPTSLTVREAVDLGAPLVPGASAPGTGFSAHPDPWRLPALLVNASEKTCAGEPSSRIRVIFFRALAEPFSRPFTPSESANPGLLERTPTASAALASGRAQASGRLAASVSSPPRPAADAASATLPLAVVSMRA